MEAQQFATLTKGTEKQIAYADRIRRENIRDLLAYAEEQKALFAKAPAATPEKTAIAHAAIEKAVTRLYRATNAVWWIENRSRLVGRVAEWIREDIKANLPK